MAASDKATLAAPGRVAALRASGLLDTGPDESFDRFTRLAARLLDVPTALVTLVAPDRQFVKSAVGLPAAAGDRRMPLDMSLCKHAVLRREAVSLVDLGDEPVPEAGSVLAEFGLRSFLGCPLITAGDECVGSLSVMDREPREWSSAEVELLEELAAAVSTEIDLRIESAERETRLLRSREGLEALSEGVTIHDAEGEVVYANRAAREILRLSESELTSRSYDAPEWEIATLDGDPIPPGDLPAARALEDGEPVRNEPIVVERPGGDPVVLSVNAVPISSRGETDLGAVISFRDVTERMRAEGRYRRLFEQSVAAVFRSEHEPPARILDCNRAFAEMFGFASREEAVGTSAFDLYPSEEERAGAMREIRAGGRQFTEPFELRGRDGRTVWVVGETRVVEDQEEGRVNEGIMFDVSDRVEARRQLRERERRFRQMAESIEEVFWLRDPESGEHLYVSPAFEEIWGRPVDELYDDPSLWLEAIHPDDRDVVEQSFGDGSSSQVDEEYRVVRPDGEVRWVRDRAFPVRGGNDEPGRMAGVARDVTEEKHLRNRLRQQALHDPLTGLANRTLLTDRVEQGLARTRRQEEPLGLLMLDVDSFKRINDRLGHAAGDRVLQALARRLEDAVRGEDTVARWGGDEFVVCLPEIEGAESIGGVRERILEAVRRPVEAGGESLRIDVSIGAVVHGDPGERLAVQTDDPEELVRFGDLALHRAKEETSAGFHVFDPEQEVQGAARIRLEQELRRALEEGRIEPFFQPIVRLEDGGLVGAEALARWRHPDRGTIAPGEFISVAEEIGLIGALGEAVLLQGAARVAEWSEDEETAAPPLISFNLSGQQFEDPALPERLSALLDEAGLPPERAVAEVTETSVMQAAAEVDELRELGLQVHIDDFGTGYSTFAYLRDLDVAGVKVGRTFVQGLGARESDLALAETILTLGRKMDLTVIAEGIETEEQRRRLEELGCEYGQGFLFAEPLPADAFADWTRSR